MKKLRMKLCLAAALCLVLALTSVGCSNSAELANLQEELDAVSAQLDSANDDLAAAEADLDTAEAGLLAAQADLDSLTDEFDALNADIEDSLWLESAGVMFVGGEEITSSGKSYWMNQTMAHYYIPKEVKYEYPIIMVPGGALSTNIYQFTPDGREGWAPMFARAGYEVYVLEPPGYFSGSVDYTDLGGYSNTKWSEEFVWTRWGLGPSFGVGFEDGQFPVDDVDELFKSFPISFAGGDNSEVKAEGIATVIDEVGPAILLTHSAGGIQGNNATMLSPAKVKGIVAIESAGTGLTEAEIIADFADKPFMSVHGDHIEVRTQQEGYQASCQAMVDTINANGGYAEMVHLPDHDVIGNCHLMMMDMNNDVVAGMIMDWLDEHVFEE